MTYNAIDLYNRRCDRRPIKKQKCARHERDHYVMCCFLLLKLVYLRSSASTAGAVSGCERFRCCYDSRFLHFCDLP